MKAADKLMRRVGFLLEKKSQDAVSIVIEGVLGCILIYLVYVLREYFGYEEVFSILKCFSDHLTE